MTVEETRHPLASKVTPVDRRSPMPAWAQVERDLRAVMDQGVEAGLQLPTEKDLATMVEAPIKTFVANSVTPRYGLVTSRIKAGLTRVVIVMQDQSLEIQPIPRKLNAGQTATLSGKLLGNLVNPKVQYTDAVGKLERAEPTSEKSFTAQLKCGDRPGRIIVSVTAEHEGANAALASFPVGCGTDLPVAAALPKPGGKEAATSDPAAVEKQLADMINAERASAGLQRLEVDTDLAKVARSISDDRAKGKGITSNELTRRLQEMDISAPTILVSEAQALSGEDAYTRLSNSPQDRANAMNSEMTHFGIGVAPGPPVDQRPTVVVSELFLKQVPPPNADEVKANLYKAISRRRTDARAGAVTKDPELEQIAQAYASQMAKDKGKVAKEKVAEIEAPLYKKFATVNELGGVKSDPLDFAEEPGIVGDAKLVGVGVGVGTSPQFGKNSTYVVILLGKRRSKRSRRARFAQPAWARTLRRPCAGTLPQRSCSSVARTPLLPLPLLRSVRQTGTGSSAAIGTRRFCWTCARGSRPSSPPAPAWSGSTSGSPTSRPDIGSACGRRCARRSPRWKAGAAASGT